MGKTRKTVWFPAFRYVVPSDFEAFLENMAANGWNIEKIGQFSSMKLTFTKTQPKSYRYVFDFNAFPKKEYKELYEQFGWELMGQMASCFIWRKEYAGERPESFSDLESRIQRNRRVKNGVLVSFFFLLACWLCCLAAGIFCGYIGEFEDVLELCLTAGLVFLMDVYLFWVVRRISRHIER